MSESTSEETRAAIERIYRDESRRALATLIRLLGDFDVAEEALHDAFGAALLQWPRDGVPANPRAWLVTTGRFKAIDKIRRRARFDAALGEIANQIEEQRSDAEEAKEREIADDLLRLIFTCCHPALPPDGRIALTLREVCGLTTEEIARAFLSAPATIAQRIVRAKAKIRDAHIPYEVPSRQQLPERLASVLQVLYLVFNEGYFPSSGEELTRPDICGEAIRLGRLLVETLGEPAAVGLLALMLLHDSRRAARATPDGDAILLEDQDRTLWNRAAIEEGSALVRRALRARPPSSYALQAAIAAVHAEAKSAADTDWDEIIGLYDVLLTVEPSPVVELNRAVAVAMRDGEESGLALIAALLERGELGDYPHAHSARAVLCERLGRNDEARAAYARALALTQLGPERRLLERRLAGLRS